MKIFGKFPTINISKNVILIFFAPSDSRFSNSCISAKYCPIITNNTSMERLFIQLQIMYKSQFHKIDPYDWFCAPGQSRRSLYAEYTALLGYIHNHVKHFWVLRLITCFLCSPPPTHLIFSPSFHAPLRKLTINTI